MNTIPRTRIRAAAVTVTLAAAVLAMPATAFAAGEAHGTYVGDGDGYSNVIGGQAAVTRLVKIGDSTVGAFCINYKTAMNEKPGADFVSLLRQNAGVPNLGKVATIAAKGRTLGKKLSDANSEAVAEQLAIWKLTDKLDYSKVPNKAIRDRATALLKVAVATPETAAGADLAATAVTKGDKSTITVSLHDIDGGALVARNVELTAAGKSQTVVTDRTGTATLDIPATKAKQAITATYKGVLPAGSIIAPATGQKLVTTAAANFTTLANVTVPAAEATPVTPTPSTSPDPKPTTPTDPTIPAPKPANTDTPTDPSKTLPHTGGWMQTWMVLGAAGLGAAALAARRKLNKPTS